MQQPGNFPFAPSGSAVQGPAVPPAPALFPDSANAASMRDCIIVADDSDLARSIVRRILQPHFDILEARTGTEVVQLLRAPPKPIDAILLDMVMPLMDGFQILDFMQQNGLLGVIPVIASTALADPQSKIQCYEAGAFDVLEKPVDADFLLFKLRRDIDYFRHVSALSSHPVAHAQVEQLEALLSALPAAIFVEDANTGVLLHCNENFLRFHGVPEKPVGQSIDTFPVAPGLLDAIRSAREALIVDHVSKPVLYKGSETSSTYSILYLTFLNPVSNVTQLLCYITNVTNEVQELTALETRIRELEGRFP